MWKRFVRRNEWTEIYEIFLDEMIKRVYTFYRRLHCKGKWIEFGWIMKNTLAHTHIWSCRSIQNTILWSMIRKCDRLNAWKLVNCSLFRVLLLCCLCMELLLLPITLLIQSQYDCWQTKNMDSTRCSIATSSAWFGLTFKICSPINQIKWIESISVFSGKITFHTVIVCVCVCGCTERNSIFFFILFRWPFQL